MINAPWIFGGVWNIAKLFMAPTTIAKVSILGNDYMVKKQLYIISIYIYKYILMWFSIVLPASTR